MNITINKEADTHLAPPPALELGTIATIRMRGHSRTNGEEYFAPAIVLNQHWKEDGTGGETIEVLIWDSTAGTHYNAAYPVRELSSRGEGGERELYEVRSNIGAILFSPQTLSTALGDIEELRGRVHRVESGANTKAVSESVKKS